MRGHLFYAVAPLPGRREKELVGRWWRGCRLSIPDYLLGLRSLGTLHQLELHRLTFSECSVPFLLNLGVVHENISPPAVLKYETVALIFIEPLNLTSMFQTLPPFLNSKNHRGLPSQWVVQLPTSCCILVKTHVVNPRTEEADYIT